MNKMSNEPYIEKEIVTVIRMYNPEYGDDRICQCGHPYYRHFDPFEIEEYAACGCKFCGCYTFVEREVNE